MKVSKEMIRPELRAYGSVLRFFWPSFSVKKFRFCNALLDRFIKGRPFTRKLNYRQKYIRREDGSELRLCIYSPKNARSGTAGLVWFHGGGYAIGVPEQDFIFAERFIAAANCMIVMPDYRRSLDSPYPAALEDCYSALLWLKENCGELGVRPDQLFVGGDSAGGGLAAAVSLYARDKGEVSVAFQMPLYPMLDDRMTSESARDNDAPVWNSISNESAWREYLGGAYGTNSVSKYAAPSRETDYSGLPPALTFVGSIEPFRDETIEYVNNLKAAGVEVSFKLFDGCFHAFDTGCAKSRPGKEAIRFSAEGLKYAAEHYSKAQP